ncbi:MAG: sensor histidine kinase, partial [Planctomycetota bacterium]
MSWLFRSLRWKIVLPVVLSTAVVIVCFAQITTTHVRRTLESREKVNLLVLAKSLSERSETWLAVVEGDGERARASVRELMARYPPLFRIELYQLDRKNRPKLLLAQGSREGTALPSWKSLLTAGVEHWHEMGEAGFLITTPVWVEKPDRVEEELTQEWSAAPTRVRGGALVLWSSNEPIELAVHEYLWSILPFGLLLFLLLMVFSVAAVRRLLRHLERLARAVESFGEGVDDVRVDVEGGDEIASLANTFNRMAGKLLESRRSIENYNRDLETEVEARTMELRDAFEKLKTLDHAKDAFLSSVSHEMRTPLTSIRSFAELLLDYGDHEKPEVRREFLTIIKKESERLTRLINQVLDLARIEAGKVTWRVTEIEFRRLLDRAVKSLSGLAYQKQV